MNMKEYSFYHQSFFCFTTVSFPVSPSSRYGSAAADPQTLAVLCKAFATLKYQAPLELEKGQDLNEVERWDTKEKVPLEIGRSRKHLDIGLQVYEYIFSK